MSIVRQSFLFRWIGHIMGAVKINNVTGKLRKDIDGLKASGNRWVIGYVFVSAVLVLLSSIFLREPIGRIAHVVELVQALLLCSTALMGLTGLMMIETKKTDVPDLESPDVFKKCSAENSIRDLARAYVFLRCALLLSVLTILFSGSCLILDNTVLVGCSVGAFIIQIIMFVYGLLFSDFLPS